MMNLFVIVNNLLGIIGLVLLAVLGITGGAYSCFTANGKMAA